MPVPTNATRTCLNPRPRAEPELAVTSDPHVVPQQGRPADATRDRSGPSGQSRTFMFELNRTTPRSESMGPGEPMPIPAMSPRPSPASPSAWSIASTMRLKGWPGRPASAGVDRFDRPRIA